MEREEEGEVNRVVRKDGGREEGEVGGGGWKGRKNEIMKLITR